MDILVLIGRILFSALFISSGINHFTNGKAMSGYAAAKGVPAPLAATYAGGVLLLAGGLSVLLGVWADLGALLLVIFLVPTAVLMHAFWRVEGQERMLDMIQFQKDVARRRADAVRSLLVRRRRARPDHHRPSVRHLLTRPALLSLRRWGCAGDHLSGR